MSDKDFSSIKNKLDTLKDIGLYPFHMPGHKRNPDATHMSEYMDIDITEIDGFDNLHDAQGIILEAEMRAAKLYGSEETHFLVNGSTSGILAAVSAAVLDGGKLLVSRNSHKALYHAAYLRRLELKYLKPGRVILENGRLLWGKTDPLEVEAELQNDKDIGAVFITTPTYDGIISDVRKIAEICHSKGVILIVDAAHGAHLGLHEDFPENAVTQGADIVIHSVHKTLASMTQTALIHVQGKLVDRNRLRRFLKIYQSSSPSYVLMASVDAAIGDIKERGPEVFKRLLFYKERILSETAACKNLYIPGEKIIRDPCKVLISAGDDAITGQQIYDILRLKYKLQPEMAGDHYALMIITGYDTGEGIDRLIKAILDMDKKITAGEFPERDGQNSGGTDKVFPEEIPDISDYPTAELTIYEAWDKALKEIELEAAEGQISGDFINLYPPGIPLIAPGERFSEKLVRSIENYFNEGRNIQGVNNRDGKRLVKVIRINI